MVSKNVKAASERNYRGKIAFYLVVAIFTLIALWPIWSVRFLPMQDYPQHLLQAQIISSYNDPEFDYNQNFTYHLQLVPYMTFYLITILLLKVFPILIAGKISTSIYLLMITVLVIRLSRQSYGEYEPWGLLLFFPFAFNQQYFSGNINFLLSLPILIFALLDHEDLTNKPLGGWPIFRHTLWQLLLFITHPLTFLIYLSFAVVGTFLSLPSRDKFLRGLTFPMIGIILFVFWFAFGEAITSGTGSPEVGSWVWTPFRTSIIYYGYMFTGMRWYDGVDWEPTVLWISLLLLILYSFYKGIKERRSFSYRYLVFFILSMLGVFFLPFGKGVYTFINLRFASVSYFLFALFVGNIRFKGSWKTIFISLIAGCMIFSVIKQSNISGEAAEIIPLVKKIPSNSRILPLVFDNDSRELDRYSFDPHLHSHNYYHIIIGGGLNPYFPKASLNPVHYRPASERPAPGENQPYRFMWEPHSADYQYFLLRGASSASIAYLGQHADYIERSGKWILFKRK